MSATRDVVVVGSGHNGLVAACYLAREGLDVEVVERDTVLGGAVSTVERWPGYAVDRGSSAHIMVRHTGIVEELGSTSAASTYLDMDPWGFAPFGPPDDQQAITFSVDLDRTCASIAAVCGERDADAYRAFVADWGARNGAVFAAFQDVPTAGAASAATCWGAGKAASVGGLEMSRQFLQPGDQLLDEHFDDERLKTALAWLGAQSGPPTPEVATADLVGWDALMHDGAARPPGRRLRRADPRAGRRLRPLGGTVRLGDGAAAITRDGDRVTGVRPTRASTIAARAVVAGCHVLTTSSCSATQALLARATDSGPDRQRLRHGRAARHDALPTYPVRPRHGALARCSCSHRAAPRSPRARRVRRRPPPTEPAVLLMTLLGHRRHHRPAGPAQRHGVGAVAPLRARRTASGGTTSRRARRTGSSRRSTGRARLRRHRRAHARADAAGPGARTGAAPRQRHARRDGPGHDVRLPADARAGGLPSPVRGLYLAGASTHPGGGVFGASGRTAARVLLRDAAAVAMTQPDSGVRR